MGVHRVLNHEAINITSAGTAQALKASSTPVTSFTIQAKVGNTGDIYVGNSTVSSTNYAIVLDAKDKHTFYAGDFVKGDSTVDLSTIYVDGGTTDDDLYLSYFDAQ